MQVGQKEYERLRQMSEHARILEGVSALLGWDQETYMPAGAAASRAEQLKTLAGVIHRERSGRKFSRALSRLIDLPTGKVIGGGMSSKQEAALREWRRDYLKATALPTKFVEQFAKATAEALVVWREAKEKKDFALFVPHLERLVEMARRKAERLGYADHPYDALLDEYEPEATTHEVDLLFSKLRRTLTPLIKKAAARRVDDSFLFGHWDVEKQMAFSWSLLDALGYDKRRGRLDLSAHPFSSASHPTDSRITTRLHPSSLMSNIFAVLHEAGHALYEMGLPSEEYGTPLGEARSLGVHESQSKWWETRIGRSRPFWERFFPSLQETFKGQLDGVSFEAFYRAIHKVSPTFIRIEADEVTYPLHVVLRFELERQLIAGTLLPREVPEAWNGQMQELLGITPAHDAEGCLQDIHWAMGAFGYFPSYTLGNLYAAHLFEGFARDHADWGERVAAGELQFVKEWLHERIYRHGRRYPTRELLERATDSPFSVDPYLRYLACLTQNSEGP